MSSHEVLPGRILEIISEVTEVPTSKIRWDSDIFRELGVDSLGAFAIMVELRRAFGTIPPSDAEGFKALDTPAKLLEYARTNTIPDDPPALQEVAAGRSYEGAWSVPELLPIDPPFRFVDSILDVRETSILTEVTHQPHHPILRAHFRGGPPVVPGAVLTEQVAQSAWLLGILSKRVRPEDRMFIGRIRSSFHRPAPVGRAIQTLVELEFERPEQGLLAFLGSVTEGETLIAHVSGIARRLEGGDPVTRSGT